MRLHRCCIVALFEGPASPKCGKRAGLPECQTGTSRRRLTPEGGGGMFLPKGKLELANSFIREGAHMKSKLMGVWIMAAGLLLLCGSVSAHHGRSNYDVSSSLTVKGIVTDFEWENPHALIHFDVTGQNGQVEKWIGETNSPTTLSRQGWTRHTVKAGDAITLVGHRVKAGSNYINFSKIIFADGKELNPAVQN